MATMFLIGGTGNQAFEFSCMRPFDKFSTLFMAKRLCKMLGWTQHQTGFKIPKQIPLTAGFSRIILIIVWFQAEGRSNYARGPFLKRSDMKMPAHVHLMNYDCDTMTTDKQAK